MAVKEYRVVKDGEVLKTYRSLPAAKQLAEKETANIYAGDECVYKVVPEGPVSLPEEEEADVAETKADSKTTAVYTLTALMNVRKEPSMTAGIIRRLPAGTKVEVEAVVDDWLHLSDGTFILYNRGKFALKN